MSCCISDCWNQSKIVQKFHWDVVWLMFRLCSIIRQLLLSCCLGCVRQFKWCPFVAECYWCDVRTKCKLSLCVASVLFDFWHPDTQTPSEIICLLIGWFPEYLHLRLSDGLNYDVFCIRTHPERVTRNTEEVQHLIATMTETKCVTGPSNPSDIFRNSILWAKISVFVTRISVITKCLTWSRRKGEKPHSISRSSGQQVR